MLPNSPRARRALRLFVLAVAIFLVLNLALRLYRFANLFGFFKPHSGIVLTQREILDEFNARQAHDNTTTAAAAAPVIPKILHQVYHNWSDPDNAVLILPADWAAAQKSCLSLHPDWEYKLWTVKTSHEFIEDNFPWFLSIYDGYKFPIQRVDVIRYFALRHFGGIYIDFDNGCRENLDAITYLPAFTTDGGHGTLSNNIIGGQPNHPFFNLLTESLIVYNWNWILPYIIVSYTSGQWFVTAIWELYHRLLSADGSVHGFEGNNWGPLHHILMDTRPDQPDPFVFWTQEHGGSWDQWDNAWFGWIGSHIYLVIGYVVGAIVGSVLFVTGCAFAWKHFTTKRSRKKGYNIVESYEIL